MAIETVTETDSLDQGRTKWNSNDAELKTITDTNATGIAANASDISLTLTQLGTTNGLVSINTNAITKLNNQVFSVLTLKTVADATTTATGWTFDLSSHLAAGYIVAPGSVTIGVNGVFYESNATQTDESGVDFYVDNNNLYFKNTSNGSTLDLLSTDKLTIRFQQTKS